MSNNFLQNLEEKEWFQRIMKSEGGLNRKEPASVGGISYAGISQKAYTEWIDSGIDMNVPINVEDLAGEVIGTQFEKDSPLEIHERHKVRVDVIVAFYQDYFKLARLEVIPECLVYMHADAFVNMKFNANRIMQKIIGFTKKEDLDGILGPASRARITELAENIDSTNNDDLIMEYHDRKLEHYESIKESNPTLYESNIKGWVRRSNHVLAELESYFHDEEPTTSAIHEDDDINLFVDPETVEVDESRPPVNVEEVITENVVREITQLLPEMIETALKNSSKFTGE